MLTILYAALFFLAGAFLWTFAEYAIHNWVGHLGKGKNEFSREHLKHHAKGDYFTPTMKKIQTAFVIVGALTPFFLMLMGYLFGGVFTLGFVVMYASYELMHRRCHTHAPRGAYGRWARKHHFYHHFKGPGQNHGVTTPIWDMVFRTYVKPGQIVVPRKQAMVWLLDENGEVREAYREDYAIKQRRSRKAANSDAETAVAAAA